MDTNWVNGIEIRTMGYSIGGSVRLPKKFIESWDVQDAGMTILNRSEEGQLEIDGTINKWVQLTTRLPLTWSLHRSSKKLIKISGLKDILLG